MGKYLILEKDLTGEKLNKAIDDLIYNPHKLKEMAKNSKALEISMLQNKL